MADVFISYHEATAGALVKEIAQTLEAHGITCWYAKRDIPKGGDFARYIPREIDACKLFLLILNEDAQQSEYIGNELALAFSRWNRKKDITILPLKIGDFQEESWIKFYLVRVQVLKTSVLDTEFMQELAHLTKEELHKKSVTQEKRELPPPTGQIQQPEPLPMAVIKSGKCGYNVTYTLENGVLRISGVGDMWDFTWNYKAQARETPWWHERNVISHVDIQDGVISIGHGAFTDCERIIRVDIPKSVKTIYYKAFSGCKMLTSIIIPEGVVRIANKAFSYCGKLTNINIPDSVTSVGGEAFSNCWSLETASIPLNLQIASNVFPPRTHIERRTELNATGA